jgi:peroxiredoxin Q/BCP
MPAEEGAAAPAFDLESDLGNRITSDDYAGKWLVLYFYPKDNTPGCTREAHDFTAALPKMKKLGAEVLGVSKDSVKTHGGFRDKEGIRYPLLSDPELEAHKAYGAWGTKTMYGKKVTGVIRSTFLVSPEGKVAKAWKGVKVDGHVDKVLAAIEAAKDGGGAASKGKATAKKPLAKKAAAKKATGKKS